MNKSLRQSLYITIENDESIGRQLFNLAYLINILKTKNNSYIKRKIVFNKDNKLYYDTLFKGLFNILDDEKYRSINFETLDTTDTMDTSKNIKASKASNASNASDDKLYTFKNIDDVLRTKVIELVYSNEDLMYAAYYKYRDVLNYFGNNTSDDDVAVMHIMKDCDTNYYNDALSLMNDAYKVTNIAVVTDDINWAKIALGDINRYGNYSFYYITSDEKYSYEINFILMSMFKNFIITDKKECAADSLWASYISYYDNKKIVVSSSISDFQNIHKYITDII
jgi:hypothetical protein